jgi:hypothetical protein
MWVHGVAKIMLRRQVEDRLAILSISHVREAFTVSSNAHDFSDCFRALVVVNTRVFAAVLPGTVYPQSTKFFARLLSPLPLASDETIVSRELS